MARNKGFRVEGIASPAGIALMARHRLTGDDVISAIEIYHQREGVRLATLIGVHADGVIGSVQKDWTPDRPDAFHLPLQVIPWIQVLELLGRVPDGTTGKLLGPAGIIPDRKKPN